MANPRIIKLAKKLKGLTTSPEPGEAENAKTRLAEVMKKYDLKPSDIEETILVVADENLTPQRLDLAKVIAVVRGVSCLTNGPSMAFKGVASRVKLAVDTYQQCAVFASAHCQLQPPSAPGQTVWQIFFWAGFTKTIYDRMAPSRPQREPEPPPQPVKVERSPLEEVMREPPAKPDRSHTEKAIEEFAQHFAPQDAILGMQRLTQEAFEAGQRHGQAVTIEQESAVTKGLVRGALVSSNTER